VVLNGHVSQLLVEFHKDCLGPLLFIAFINDLPSVVFSSIFMFTDDAKIFDLLRIKMTIKLYKVT